MDKNLHDDDNLQSFLRDELNKINELPPDELWSNIAARTRKPAKQPRLLVLWKNKRSWLVAASFLFISFASFAIYFSQKKQLGMVKQQVKQQQGQIKHLEKRIDTLKQYNTFVEKTNDAVEDNNVHKNNTTKSTTHHNNQKKENTPQFNAQLNLKKEKNLSVTPIFETTISKNNTLQENNISNNIIQIKTDVPNEKNIHISPTPHFLDTIISKEIQKEDIPSIIALDLLPTHNFITKTNLPSIAAYVEEKTHHPKTNEWSVGAYFSPLYSYRKVSENTNNHPPMPPKRPKDEEENPAFSYEAGMKLAWSPKKHWAIETGISYINIQQISQPQSIDLQYDTSKEEETSEGVSSRQSVEVSTAYGNHQVKCHFVRDKQHPIANGERIRLAFRVDEQLQMVGLPLTTKYFYDFGKLRVGLSAGGRYAYLFKRDTEIKTFKTKDRPGQFLQAQAQLDLDSLGSNNSLQKNHFELTLGAEAAYAITPQLKFYVAPNYRHSLTPIYNARDVYTTTTYSFGIQTGINYTF